jgi:hypothetical protein
MLTEKQILKQISAVQMQKIKQNPDLAALMEVHHEEVSPEMPADWSTDSNAKEEVIGWGSWSFGDPLFAAFKYQQADKLQQLQKMMDNFAEQAKVQSFKVIAVLMLVLAVLAKIADWSSFETVQIGVLLVILVKFLEVADGIVFMKVMISKIAAGTDHLRYVVTKTGGNQVARVPSIKMHLLIYSLSLDSLIH